MYAITGVTGKVGGELARTLLAAGRPVRAVVRDARKGEAWRALGCDVALAAIEDAAALARALRGAEAAFILPPPVFDPQPGYPEARTANAAVVKALEDARPARVVCLSTVGADAEEDNLLSQRTLLETALAPLSLPLTILRPAWFIDNAAWDVASARDEGVIRSFLQPLDRRIPMVAAEDVGRTAAALIQEPWRGRRIVELEGPRRLSPNDLADAFSEALGRTVRAETVPRAVWEPMFRAQGMQNPAPRIRMLDGFNEGWIAFRGEQATLKGKTDARAVIATLVA